MQQGSRFDRCNWLGCHASCVDEIELCDYHFRFIGQTFMDKRSIFGAAALTARREERGAAAALKPPPPDPDDWSRSRSVIYYMRTPDQRHIKIGYTIHLPDRMSQLRVSRDALLAVEPGWKETERERHAQFAEERQGKGRREDFNPSRRLLAHIDVARSKFGEPFAYAKRRAISAGPQPVPAA